MIEFTNYLQILCDFYEHNVIIKEIGTLNYADIKHLFILILKIFFHWQFGTKPLLFPFSKQKQSLSSETSLTSSKRLTTETTTFKMSVSKGKPDGSECSKSVTS